MQKKATQLVDEHLESIQGMQEAETDDFFYARLKARMERNYPQQSWIFPLRPVWIVGTLLLLLAVNGFMLTQQTKTKKATANASFPALQHFAESYDQTISSSY